MRITREFTMVRTANGRWRRQACTRRHARCGETAWFTHQFDYVYRDVEPRVRTYVKEGVEAKTWEPMEWPDPITEHSENCGDGVTALSCRKCWACYAKRAFEGWALRGELPEPVGTEGAEAEWFTEQAGALQAGSEAIGRGCEVDAIQVARAALLRVLDSREACDAIPLKELAEVCLAMDAPGRPPPRARR
jgi:hypothetical protein